MSSLQALNTLHLEGQGPPTKRGIRRWFPFLFRKSATPPGAEIPMQQMGLGHRGATDIEVLDTADSEFDWDFDSRGGRDLPVYQRQHQVDPGRAHGFIRHHSLEPNIQHSQQQQQQQLKVEAEVEHIYEPPPEDARGRDPIRPPSFPPPAPPPHST